MSLILDLLKEKKKGLLLNTAFKKTFGQEAGNNLDKIEPYFVLSTGRVGTKTLSTILKELPELLSFHEPTPKLYSLSKQSYDLEKKGVTEISDVAFLIIRKKHLKLSLFHNQKYIETGPQCTFLAPSIKKALPNTKFIHLIRSPEQVIKSGVNRGWYNGHSHDEFRITPTSESEFFELWEQFSVLEKNLWLWTETNNWIFEFLSNLLPADQYFIRSNDLFSYNEKKLNYLFNFLDTSTVSPKTINKVLSKKLNNNKRFDIEHLDLSSVNGSLLEYYESVKKRAEF